MDGRSRSDEQLFLLEDLQSFSSHCERMLEAAQRELVILSRQLDPALFDRDEVRELISQLARRDRRARVRILAKDIQPMTERGHRLLNLARRLSSKVEIRKLVIEPENDRRAYLIGDRDLLLYQHEEGHYQGFANYAAGPEAAKLLDEFNQLWEQHGEQDIALRRLQL